MGADKEQLNHLVDKARHGDLAAFEEIVRRFQAMAHGYAYSLLSDFQWAEDAAQEAFIAAFLKLPSLMQSEAFPGWFRRIVFTQCGRIERQRRMKMVPLDNTKEMPTHDPGPAELVVRAEMREQVSSAVQSLPERQREVVTMFYMGGHSHAEIADFLEVPVSTIKKRLHDARESLKGRMMKMVDETLKGNAPGDNFPQQVITELLDRPHPLQIQGHPIRDAVIAIRHALPEYDFIEGEEILERAHITLPIMANAYPVDANRILRTQTSDTLLKDMPGRPLPVRLLTAGRVFRQITPEQDRAGYLRIFHQLDALCVQAGVGEREMKALLDRAIRAILDPVELKYGVAHYPGYRHCLEISIKQDGDWLGIGGCGLLAEEILRKGRFDAQAVDGFAFGFGLERLVLVKLGLEGIGQLWQPPYVLATGEKGRA